MAHQCKAALLHCHPPVVWMIPRSRMLPIQVASSSTAEHGIGYEICSQIQIKQCYFYNLCSQTLSLFRAPEPRKKGPWTKRRPSQAAEAIQEKPNPELFSPNWGCWSTCWAASNPAAPPMWVGICSREQDHSNPYSSSKPLKHLLIRAKRIISRNPRAEWRGNQI